MTNKSEKIRILENIEADTQRLGMTQLREKVEALLLRLEKTDIPEDEYTAFLHEVRDKVIENGIVPADYEVDYDIEPFEKNGFGD